MLTVTPEWMAACNIGQNGGDALCKAILDALDRQDAITFAYRLLDSICEKYNLCDECLSNPCICSRLYPPIPVVLRDAGDE